MPGKVAGTEIYVASLAKELIQKGHEVAVIKPNYDTKEFKAYEYEGIKVLEYPESFANSKKLKTGKKYPEGILFYEEILKKEKPDVIHFHEISGSNGITIQHLRIAKQLNIRVFTTFHLISYVCMASTLLYKGQHPCDGVINIKKCTTCMLHQKGFKGASANVLGNLGMRFQKMGFDFSDRNNLLASLFNYPGYIIQHKNILDEIFEISEKVFALNNWFRDILINNQLPAEKIIVAPQILPGLNLDKAKELFNEKGRGNQNMRFVFVGRICKIKGLDILLKALKGIKNENWELDIYGNVTEENFYHQCLALSKGNQRIRWKGIIPPSEVVGMLQNYDVLAFPTMVQEMSPLITLEAFAAGIPVLSPDILASRESIIEGKNGWLFQFRDMLSLQDKLQYLLSHRSEAKNVKQGIKNANGLGAINEKHSGIYYSHEGVI